MKQQNNKILVHGKFPIKKTTHRTEEVAVSFTDTDMAHLLSHFNSDAVTLPYVDNTAFIEEPTYVEVPQDNVIVVPPDLGGSSYYEPGMATTTAVDTTQYAAGGMSYVMLALLTGAGLFASFGEKNDDATTTTAATATAKSTAKLAQTDVLSSDDSTLDLSFATEEETIADFTVSGEETVGTDLTVALFDDSQAIDLSSVTSIM